MKVAEGVDERSFCHLFLSGYREHVEHTKEPDVILRDPQLIDDFVVFFQQAFGKKHLCRDGHHRS